MADPVDIASAAEEAFRQVCLQRRPKPQPVSDGTCWECGGDIEPARLAAMPTATQCIECAMDVEYMDLRGR